MKKLLTLVALLFSLIGCNTPETPTTENTQGSLFIPERYHGEFHSVQGNLYAKIEAHKLTAEIGNGATEIKTEGITTIDNGTTHFEATLSNNEKLILLKGNGFIGITLSRNGNIYLSRYYE